MLEKEYAVSVQEALVHELKQSMNRGPIHEIFPDGSEYGLIRKAEVDRFQGIKVEIFSNEHPPPHFRVVRQGSAANFKISDCSLLNGNGEILDYQKNIYKWWKKNKPLLIQAWNERRPVNCPVGIYKE